MVKAVEDGRRLALGPWRGVDGCERRYLGEGRYVWGLNVSGVKGDTGNGNGEVLLQWCV